jgi:hypothetical protein
LNLTVDGVVQAIAISGEALGAQFGTTPATGDFGPVCAGTPAMLNVAVYASNEAPIQVTSVTPPAAPAFDVTNLVAALQPLRGNEETVSVTVSPTDSGEYDDTFVINSNIPGMAAHAVPLHALVLAAGVSPTPDVVKFGVAMVDVPTLAREVVVTNCSDSAITIRGGSVLGGEPGEFAPVSEAAAVLEPAERHAILVVMTPKANGARRADLVLDVEGGPPISVPLEGEGFGVAPIDRETYYACASGRRDLAWPVAVVLVVLTRRRRRPR